MSFDPMGYPRFDDCREIGDQFYGNIIGQKDAEIDRLNNVVRATEVERDAADQVCDNLRAEVQRQEKAIRKLEECNEYLMGRVLENNQLITELADALEHADWTSDYEQRWKNNDLIQRAREATR
jgi:hypothetical protein